MLQPLDTVRSRGEQFGYEEAEIQARQDKLLAVLLNPNAHGAGAAKRHDGDHLIVSVYAHGEHAVRVVSTPGADARPMWGIQQWDVEGNTWGRAELLEPVSSPGARDRACDTAIQRSGPPLGLDEIFKKWSRVEEIMVSDANFEETAFPSKADLAEFWYDHKPIAGIDGQVPWGFVVVSAESIFENGGYVDPRHGPKRSEKIETQNTNFALAWREIEPLPEKPIVATDPRYPNYVVSVYQDRRTPADIAADGAGYRQTKLDHRKVIAEDMEHLASGYGITSPSSPSPSGAPHIWFQEPRPYLHDGAEERHSLHIHAVDGRELEAEDYQRAANFIGAQFEHPIALPEDEILAFAEPLQELDTPVVGEDNDLR